MHGPRTTSANLLQRTRLRSDSIDRSLSLLTLDGGEPSTLESAESLCVHSQSAFGETLDSGESSTMESAEFSFVYSQFALGERLISQPIKLMICSNASVQRMKR